MLFAGLAIMLAAPALSEARDLYFGINANTRAWGSSAGEEQGRVAETGVRRLREDLEWSQVEPANGEWNWSATDELFEAAAEHEMSILPLLDSSPCWAVSKEVGSEDCWRTYPESNADYADFVAHAAARYGPGGDFWEAHPGLNGGLAPSYFEIWNEPYYDYFTNGDVDPARYAGLYKAAAIAGREANPATKYLVESNVDVELSNEKGPEGEPIHVNWAAGMVEAQPEIGKYIDGIAIHPYPENHEPDYPPENGSDASFKNTDRIYGDWVKQGVNRPIWITEIGYSACDNALEPEERCVPGEAVSAREEQKAEWLTDIFNELGSDEYAYVHAVYLYNFRQWSNPEEPDGNYEEWLGILNGNGERLPAWYSFANAIEEYDGVPVPNTTITGHSFNAKKTKITLTFVVNDPTSSLECQLDSGTWTACTSPKSYTIVSGSHHTFRVRATNAEATESFPAEYSW